MADFTASFGKQIDLVIKEGVREFEEEFRRVAMNAYDKVLAAPVLWSGYYKSNHRISIRSPKGTFKTGGKKLFPSQKEEFPELLKYIGNVEITRSEELAKLSKLELGDTFEISTIVPYADEIETKHRVYSTVEALIRASK